MTHGNVSLPLPQYQFAGAGVGSDDPEKGEEFYEALTCAACSAVHLVNSETGNVLGADGKK